jgi:hypothetical protein
VKKLLAGITLGLIIGAAGTALARGDKTAYLNRGDSAVGIGGATQCRAAPHAGSRLGFVCRVGGDYRAAYGVMINEREAAITQYTGFTLYRVLIRRVHCSACLAHSLDAWRWGFTISKQGQNDTTYLFDHVAVRLGRAVLSFAFYSVDVPFGPDGPRLVSKVLARG